MSKSINGICNIGLLILKVIFIALVIHGEWSKMAKKTPKLDMRF